jgi:hypothetical protein
VVIALNRNAESLMPVMRLMIEHMVPASGKALTYTVLARAWPASPMPAVRIRYLDPVLELDRADMAGVAAEHSVNLAQDRLARLRELSNGRAGILMALLAAGSVLGVSAIGALIDRSPDAASLVHALAGDWWSHLDTFSRAGLAIAALLEYGHSPVRPQAACTGRCRSPIPDHVDQGIRLMSIRDSGPWRPVLGPVRNE